MNLRVGQVVACIWDNWHECGHPLPPSLPIKRCVYTIRSINWWVTAGDYCLQFAEVSNPPMDGYEPAFLHSHFRPVATTDISLFKGILTPRMRENAL